MIRRIIRIDKEKCNGCGACADACHEGAIDIINGKAELVREHFCDGLGDCLPECPTGAISFEEREAPEYDEEAVKEAQKKISAKNQAISAHTGCPGSRIMQIQQTEAPETDQSPSTGPQISRLQNWPVQIKLAPVHAIIQQNDIQSVTILRMEVPCCGGLEMAAKKALQNSGKFIPWQVVTIGIDGKIME